MVIVFSVMLSMFRSFIGGTLICVGSIAGGVAEGGALQTLKEQEMLEGGGVKAGQ